MEMGRRIGMTDCKAYSRTYENSKHPANNLEGIRKICQVLEVDEELIFDSYMKFLSGDYPQKLKQLREALGKSRKGMDELMGNSHGLYARWERRQQVPARKSVEKVLGLMGGS